MLTSFFVGLDPVADPQVEPDGGHVNGWFFRSFLGEVNPSLATELHAANRLKPLTLWAGRRFDRPPGDRSGADLALRITSLSQPLSHLLASNAPRAGDRIRLGTSSYLVRQAEDDEPWTSHTTYAALWESCMQYREPEPLSRLVFLSPTVFAGDEGGTLFPEPRLVFESLLRRWMAHSAVTIPEQLVEEFRRATRVEAHQIWTALAVCSRFSEKGFLGWCEYSISRTASRDAVRLLHLLSAFAFYSGVGSRTAWGMGQVLCQ